MDDKKKGRSEIPLVKYFGPFIRPGGGRKEKREGGLPFASNMKARKYKRSAHQMKSVYEAGFGMYAPYQILVDASMCRASLQHRWDLKERLPHLLGGSTRSLVTACTMEALRELARSSPDDPTATGAPFVGRRLELRRCRHDPVLSEVACWEALLAEGNPYHYGVATAEEKLKRVARAVAGTPLIFLEKTFPLLEAPSSLTLAEMRRREEAKLHVSSHERALIKKTLEGGQDEISPVPGPVHKRRRAKGPNPLSVKKSSRRKNEHELGAGRRKRRHRKKAIQDRVSNG